MNWTKAFALTSFLAALVASSQLKASRKADGKLPAAKQTTANQKAELVFPPRVIFCGLRFWDIVVDLADTPFVFVTDFELNFNLFKKYKTINYGLKLTSQEILMLNTLNSEELYSVISQYQERFKSKVGKPFHFCISERQITPEVQVAFNDYNIAHFRSTRWSVAAAANPSYQYLYLPINFPEDRAALVEYNSFLDHPRVLTIIDGFTSRVERFRNFITFK